MRGTVTDGDRSMVLRIVGLLEYSAALQNFDTLLRLVTPEELAAIDELISERPEFTVKLDLAESLVTGPSTLIPIEPGRVSEGRGLAWVMALARVELAGILANFEIGTNPFALVNPSRFEWEAYQDLLLDDSQVHYWSLRNDPHFDAVANSMPDVPMLAYVRRLNLAMQVLRAAAESRGDKLTAVQFTELSQQYDELGGLRDALRFKVASFVADQSTSRRTEKQMNVVQACARLLRGEQEELTRGTARVEQFELKPAGPDDD